jgi:N-acetylmuramoyl-L-alanine amidase
MRTGALALALALTLSGVALAHDTGKAHDHDARMSRAEIRHAQERLNGMGYPIEHPDGVIGPKTETAIRNFQRDKGLNATGELTTETVDALEARSGSETSGAGAR